MKHKLESIQIGCDGLLYDIDLVYDDKANVFIATSDDVPGLITEAAKLTDLMAEVGELIPVLLRENERSITLKTVQAPSANADFVIATTADDNEWFAIRTKDPQFCLSAESYVDALRVGRHAMKVLREEQ